MDTQTQIMEIDKLLAKISVSGDSVMLLAAVRQRITALYDSIKPETEESK